MEKPQRWTFGGSSSVAGRRHRGIAISVATGLLAAASIVATMTVARAQSSPPDSQPAVHLAPETAGASGDDATELAKKLQNPIGDLYSIPFQNNTNFNYGPNKGTQDILNIQPVIPIHVTDEWNVITRTILPLIWQPSLQPR